MKKSELLPALFMLALSGAIAFDTRRLSFWDDTTPGPAFLPLWLALAGVALFALRMLEARRVQPAPPDWPGPAGLLRVALIFAALLAVPLLAPLTGLLPAIALLVLFVVLAVLRQPLWPSLATAALTMGLIYGIFVGWLGVALPKGPLGL